MSEAPAGGGGRENLERNLARRSMDDEGFRQQLLGDPKGAVELALGSQLPPEVRVEALEETADTVYLVIPPSSLAGGGGELSDEQLQTVAGGECEWGTLTPGCTANDSCY